MIFMWEQQASLLIWCTAEQQVSRTVIKGKILTSHRKAREKWCGAGERKKEKKEMGKEKENRILGKGEERPHPMRSKRRKKSHRVTPCPPTGGKMANRLGSRGLGKTVNLQFRSHSTFDNSVLFQANGQTLG